MHFLTVFVAPHLLSSGLVCSYFFYVASATLTSLSLLILEVTRSHSDTTTVGRTPLDK